MQYMISKEPGRCLTLESELSLLHIVVLAGNKWAGEMKTFRIPYDGHPDVNLQFVNACEDEEDGTIVLDAIRSTTADEGEGEGPSSVNAHEWPWASTLSSFRSTSAKKSLWRYTVQPRTGATSRECITGCFAPADEANWTHEEIERQAKLADKMEKRGSMWNEVKSDFSGLGLRFDDMAEYFGELM